MEDRAGRPDNAINGKGELAGKGKQKKSSRHLFKKKPSSCASAWNRLMYSRARRRKKEDGRGTEGAQLGLVDRVPLRTCRGG